MSLIMNQATSVIPIGGVATLTPDAGGAISPAAGNINILGAHGINTSGAGSTLTVAVDNTLTLGDLSAVGAGSPSLTLTTGDLTVTSGNINLPTTADADNGVIEVNGGRFIHSFGGTNTFVGADSGNLTLTGFSSVGIGAQSLQSVTSGAFNVAAGFLASGLLRSGSNNVSIGAAALRDLTTTGSNTSLGSGSLQAIVTGTNNVAAGYLAGSAATTNDSNNIFISNIGVAGDNGKIRIGTSATHTSTFIAGIEGVNVGSVAEVVTIDSNELGSAVITAGAGISVTPTANVITIAATGSSTVTAINFASTPYTVLAADQILSTDTSGGAISVLLPDAPSTGRIVTIKDASGNAVANNLTVTTVGGAVLIDAAATFVMNTAYMSVTVVFNGTKYLVI